MRLDKPKSRRDRSELPPVRVGRCGIIACADGCLADCRTCCDTKWTMAAYEPGREAKLAGTYGPNRCPDCEFAEDREDPNRQRRLLLTAAGFNDGREPVGTLRDYNPNMQEGKGREQARMALQATKNWALGEGPHLLVIVGNTGVGKTHLAEGAVEYLTFTRRKQAVLVSGEDFVFELASYLSANQENRMAYEQRMRDVDYLALDEVGVAYGKDGMHNEFVSSIYQRIIGWRFNNGKPTMVTGNLSGDTAIRDILGDRVFSRLEDSRFSLALDLWDARNLRPQMKGRGR